MKESILYFLLLILLFSSGCRSEFEKIRISGDAEKMFNEANSLYEKEEYRKAITLYEMIIPAYRGKAEAEDIAYHFAMANYLNGSYTLSGHYFKSFADTFTASPRREEAMYLSAYSNYRLSPRHQLDQDASQKAIDAFQLFVNTFPTSERIEKCNTYIDELRKKMETKIFESGKLYYHTRNYSSAIQTLENMLKDYPESQRTEEARFLIVKSSYDWANNSIFARQEERYQKTVEKCNAYLKKHVDSGRYAEVMDLKDKCQKELNSIQNG